MNIRPILAIICLFITPALLSAQEIVWSDRAGGIDADFASGITTDGSGNRYIAGYYNSPSIVFGSSTLTNAGNFDMVLAKYDPAGNVSWAVKAGGTSSDVARTVAVDPLGDIYVAGEFYSPSISFGAHTLTGAGGGDVFLVKYDPDGNPIWARRAGGPGTDLAWSVCLDASGNSYLAGSFTSPSMVFGTDTLANSGGEDIFILKSDPDGNVVWAKRAGGTASDAPRSIAVDGTGHFVLGGYFGSASITFGTTVLVNSGAADMFVARYDTSGTALWARGAGGIYSDLASSVDIDAGGNTVVVGTYRSPSVTFGAFRVVNVFAGESDMFAARYTASGSVLWAHRIGGTLGNSAPGIALSTGGDIYLTGQFRSTYDATVPAGHAGEDLSDVWVRKYDSDGTIIWSVNAGGSTGDNPQSISLDSSGNTHVTGYFLSPVIGFGPDTLTNAGNSDAFLFTLREDVTDVPAPTAGLPGSFLLSRNYPNPFNPATTIRYTIPAASHVVIRISDVLGETVTTLVDGIIAPGEHSVTWDASHFPSGIYFCRMISGSYTTGRKMVLLR